MIKNHNYEEEFPIVSERFTYVYKSRVNSHNFTIRRLPFLSLISVGNRLSTEQIKCVSSALCEYASEFDAFDSYLMRAALTGILYEVA